MCEKGIVNGTSEETFSPDSPILREELVKIICGVLNLNCDDVKRISFSDLNENHWSYKYVAKAYEYGIIKGVSDTMFGTGEPVTRQDICVILSRLMENNGKSNLEFTDKDKIADYAKDAVSLLSSKGIVSGFDDKTFKPYDKCTRGQAVLIIYNQITR